MALENNVPPPVNFSYLEEYTDGDQEMMDELIEAFLETTSEGMAELQRGVEAEDTAVWTKAAHKLKGSAGYLGAEEMKALCAKAEGMQNATSEERLSFYKTIMLSCTTVCDFLNERRS